jgi:hypothetical protein
MVRLYDVKPVVEVLNKVGASAFLYSDDNVNIGKYYRAELLQVRTYKQFKRHIERWRSFYALESSYTRLSKRFNMKRVYKVWKRIDRGVDTPMYNGRGEIFALAAEVVLPSTILVAHQVASKYQAPFNVALVQLYNQGGKEFF